MDGRERRARLEQLDADAAMLTAALSTLDARIVAAEAELRAIEVRRSAVDVETQRLSASELELGRLIAEMEVMMAQATRPSDPARQPLTRPTLVWRVWSALREWWAR